MKLSSSLTFAFLLILIVSSCFSNKEIRPDKIPNDKTLQEFLLRGWNTWNNPDLMNHVYMPEGLSVKLNFRKDYTTSPPYYMNNSFFAGPDNTISGKVKPNIHYFDASYTDLKVSWEGLTARIQTATDYEDLLILYTPEQVSDHNHLLVLEAGILWGKQGRVEKKENFIQAEMGNLVYSIRATAADQKIPLPVCTPYLSFPSDKEIAFYTGKTRSLDLIRRIMVKRDERNKARAAVYGEMEEIYMAMHNVLSWNTIYDPFNHRYITPGNRYLNEAWGGYFFSGNDMYFTAAMFALDNKWRAYSNFISVTRNITPEGFLPGYTGALKNEYPCSWSQPPVGSLIAMLIYNKWGDKWFLKEIYDQLLEWNRWWEKSRNNRTYLSWGCTPQSKNNPVIPPSEAAIFESGKYNSPLFENIVFNPKTKLYELASVDLLSLYVADCKSLAEMAEILGKSNDKQELLARAEKYAEKLQELWDEETGIFRDKDLISNEFTKNISLTGFYPLIAGVPSETQARRMVEEHLLNGEVFFGDFMIPFLAGRHHIAAKDDSLNTANYITGPMNFLVYMGLQNYNFTEACNIIAGKSANILMKEWIKGHRTYSAYNPQTGEGINPSADNALSIHGGLLSLIALMDAGYWDKESDE